MNMEDDSASLLNRRDVVKLGAAAAAAGLAGSRLRAQARRPKKIVIGGGGIGGLSCAYELMKRGHDVTVLEAAGKTGGHVRTIRDRFADGLYVDAGAEHFTKPGYDLCWNYFEEFNLPVLGYPRRENYVRFIDGKAHTEEMLADRAVLKKFGFNQREIEYLVRREWWELPLLYYGPYLDSFEDEYRPFDAGLNELDQIPLTDLMKKDGASAAAVRFIGGSSVSALQQLWEAAILKIRGVPLWPSKVFRIKGGNQVLTDTFTRKLGERVRVGSPVTAIEHGDTGVTVHFHEFGKQNKIDADYLVCSMSAWMLRKIPVTPDWPEAKAYAIHNMTYYAASRPMFQSRTRFWEQDGVSPNVSYGEPTLGHSWPTGDDVQTARGLIVATAQATVDAQAALKTFREYYPGKSENIEYATVHDWSRDPWAAACERLGYKVGSLAKFWPVVTEPHGRVYFAGAYADNLGWGMEAAARSANRVAKAIDNA